MDSPRSSKERAITIVLATEMTVPMINPSVVVQPIRHPIRNAQEHGTQNSKRAAQNCDPFNLQQIPYVKLDSDGKHEQDDADLCEYFQHWDQSKRKAQKCH